MGAGDKILRTVRDKHHTLVLRVKTVSLTVGRSLVGTYFSNILSKSGWDDRDSSIRRPKCLREPQRGDVEINTFYQLSFCSCLFQSHSTQQPITTNGSFSVERGHVRTNSTVWATPTMGVCVELQLHGPTSWACCLSDCCYLYSVITHAWLSTGGLWTESGPPHCQIRAVTISSK